MQQNTTSDVGGTTAGPRMVLRAHGAHATEIELGPGRVLGGRAFVVMAGPCAVEDAASIDEAAGVVAEAGCPLLRGGGFKPRTSPYSFQGLGAAGVRMLAEAARRRGLLAVSEIVDRADLPAFEGVALVQVGARNMQNFALLKALARQRRPVLLKRAASATVEEWLSAAEYLLTGGNDQVVLCERGSRGFEPATRNTLDLSAVVLAKRLTHLPVVVDPSHASGRRELVIPLSLAAAAAGADGLLIEMHPHPERALCDGAQALLPGDLRELMQRLGPLLAADGRELWSPAERRKAAGR